MIDDDYDIDDDEVRIITGINPVTGNSNERHSDMPDESVICNDSDSNGINFSKMIDPEILESENHYSYCQKERIQECRSRRTTKYAKGVMMDLIENSKETPKPSLLPIWRRKLVWLLVAVLFSIAVIAIIYIVFHDSDFRDSVPDTLDVVVSHEQGFNAAASDTVVVNPSFVEMIDTIVDGSQLTILTPVNGVPRLCLGTDVLADSSAALVVQAADIRRDNGMIVGAYVLEGNLLSRGQSKSGFCAIINDRITIGVADATPLLEQSIENEGYFFRQYPLVVGGQMVENKLKLTSLRKALVELNGRISVVMTRKRMTLNQFAQILVDLGVTNAIYLVGSSTFGFARDANGRRIEFGRIALEHPENINYIVWQ